MLNIASRARPYFGAVVLLAALLTVGGICSFPYMASSVYPELTFPRITIVVRVPNKTMANMEVQVTRPLEQELITVIGVSRVRAKTIRGASEISVDFSPSTDMRWAKADTWNHIGAVRSKLPPDVELTVEQMTPSVVPILSVVLTGGDSSSELRDFAYYQLAPLIKNIPDVLRADVAGGDIREIEVEARPDALLAAGLSAADLADQLGKLNVIEPVGRIERQPFAYHLMVDTQSHSAEQIEQLVISTKGSQPLRVGDVADVKVSHQDRVMSIGYERHDAVAITVFRRLGGNTVDVSRGVQELLAKHPIPTNLHATLVYDQASFVDTSVKNVRDAIVVGGFFSILILLLFLRSWRATLILALAIPTTLAITFLFLYASGATLNLMSLGGLAVAIGLIIDDTVVVIENIARHLAPAGRDVPFASADGQAQDPVAAASGEITGAVVGSTLTTVLVFLPLVFIVGVYGQFFASLAWALAVAVLVSMVISLTLIPVFAARFLAGKPMPEPGRIYRFVEHIYERVLALALRFWWASLAVSLAAVAFGIVLYVGIRNPWAREAAPQQAGPNPREFLVSRLETGLMPAMDEGAFTLDYWAPTGTPLARTEEMAQKLEEILSNNPDVKAYVRRTGTEMGIFATQTSRGDIQVVLRPAEDDPWSLLRKRVRPGPDDADRKDEYKQVQEELKKKGGRERIRQKYRRRSMSQVMDEVSDEIKDSFSERQLKTETMPIMTDELNDLSGANKPVEIELFGPDYRKLRGLAEQIGEKLEKSKIAGLGEINTGVFAGNPDLKVKVNKGRAAKLGLTAQEIDRQLEAMYAGQITTKVPESAARITDVRVRYPDWARFGQGTFDPERVLQHWILLPESTAPASGAPGGMAGALAGPSRALPLSSFASLSRERTPDEQWRENQLPAHFVTAELKARADLGAVIDGIHKVMASVPMPSGYHWALGGYYIQQQRAFTSLLIVMAVAILLVFIMLAFQFRSVVLPLLIFMTQPLSLVSGLFALWLTGTQLNVSSYMGAILLIGLDMKNGILLVEYIQQLRGRGMALQPALLLAGRTRFRPILMTSLAAILGLLPLALGIGPGAQMQQPLAIMVIGGLTANMLFTRMIIPVGYEVLERLKGKDDRAWKDLAEPMPSTLKTSPKGEPA